MDLAAAYEQELCESMIDMQMPRIFEASMDLQRAYEQELRESILDQQMPYTVHTCWQTNDPTDLASFYTSECRARGSSIGDAGELLGRKAAPASNGPTKAMFEVQPRQTSYDSTMTAFPMEFDLEFDEVNAY